MTLKAIDTDATVAEDGVLSVRLPEVPAGRYRVIVIVDQPRPAPVQEPQEAEAWRFPTIEDARWPEDMPLRREDMYGDNGR